MKVFISHSSEDKQIATILSSLLESIDSTIEVFCSSQIGSIKAGQDFVKAITKELDVCDIFIPLLSTNYYKSRYAMIELGFSYSCLYYKYSNSEFNYIYPLSVPPIKKGEALAHTPLACLQVLSIDDANEMRVYIQEILENKGMSYTSGINKQINCFIYNINQILLKNVNLLNSAKILLCKSGDVPGNDNDYLDYSFNSDNSGYTINFRAKPFANSNKYPDFLSFVFKYIDKIDLYSILNHYKDPAICFEINNYTNSINQIDLEIKYSDVKDILYRKTIDLSSNETDINIPLNEIKSEALKQVTEICFVIHSSSYIEDEGMFQIKNFKIKFE